MRYIVPCLLTSLVLAASPLALAKPINLYDQPLATAKATGTIDSDKGIITIFTPKDGQWVKVADPNNGNVGWVKASDLNNMGFSFNMISTGSGPHAYQMVQVGGTQPFTEEQMHKAMKEFELRQQAIQKEMQQVMQDTFKMMNEQWASLPWVVPVKTTTPATPSKPAATQAKPQTSAK